MWYMIYCSISYVRIASCGAVQDDFVLRAREKIDTDEEITVSYLGEERRILDDALTTLRCHQTWQWKNHYL